MVRNHVSDVVNPVSNDPRCDEWGCVPANQLRQGDKIAVCFGIITVDQITNEASGRKTIWCEEPQPSITVDGGYTFRLMK